MSLKITLLVDAKLAIESGSTGIGKQTIELSDADLAELTPEQRNTLARHVGGDWYWQDCLSLHAEPHGRADKQTIRALLDTRRMWALAQERNDQLQAEKERARLEKLDRDLLDKVAAFSHAPVSELVMQHYGTAKLRSVHDLFPDTETIKRVYGDSGDTGHRAYELPLATVLGRENEANAELERVKQELEQQRERERAAACAAEREREGATVAWLKRNGFEEQATRCEAGYLPADELEQLLVEVLFAPLGPAYEPPRYAVGDDVSSMSAESFAKLQQLCERSTQVTDNGKPLHVEITARKLTRYEAAPSDPHADLHGDVSITEMVAVAKVRWNRFILSAMYQL